MPARLLTALLLAALAPRAHGEAPLAPASEALLVLRLLAYDRQVTSRARDAVTVAVAARPGDEAGLSRQEAIGEALVKAASQFTVAGLPVKWVAVPAGAADLADRLRAARASVLLLVGAAAADPAPACRAAREARVLSVAERHDAVEACVAVGVVLRGARAGLLVNLAAARAEGADLEPALLAVAELVEPPPPR